MSWETAKLGEVCTIEKGNIGIMKAIPGEYPLIVLGAERKTHNEFQFDDEAVIIPLVSSTGHGHRSMKRIFFQTGKFSIGSILCAVIPKDKTQLSAEFLYRYLDFNKENELVARMKGMANVTLPMKEIADVEIPLPPLEIQKELIEEFQKVEFGTNQISTELNHQLALVKELRQAYLREAMQGKLVAQDEWDEPAEILLEKIKAEKEKLVAEKRIRRDKPLPPINAEEIPFEIPSNWTWCRLGKICEFEQGIQIDLHKQSSWEKEGLVRFLRIIDFTQEIDEWRFVENPGEKYIITQEDLVMVRYGATAGFVGTNKKGVLANNLFKIKFYLTNKKFLKRFFETSYFYFELSQNTKGVAMPAISFKFLDYLLFPLSPLAEQERIVAKLEKLMKFCDELEANIRQGIANADQLLQTALKEALEPR